MRSYQQVERLGVALGLKVAHGNLANTGNGTNLLVLHGLTDEITMLLGGTHDESTTFVKVTLVDQSGIMVFR